MISKRDIKRMVKHVTKRDRGIPDKRLLHPAREWVIALVLCFVMLLLGSIGTYVGFSEYANISLEGQMLESSEINYDRIDTKDAIELYEIYLLEYKNLTEDVPKVIMEEPEPEADELEETEEENKPEETVLDKQETKVIPEGVPVLE